MLRNHCRFPGILGRRELVGRVYWRRVKEVMVRPVIERMVWSGVEVAAFTVPPVVSLSRATAAAFRK